MQTPDLHLFSSAQQPTHTFSVLQLEFVLPSYNQASRAGHQTRHKNWWLLFNNKKTMLFSIHESEAMASTQLLFFIPAFHTLSRWQLYGLLHKLIHVQVTQPLDKRLGWFPQHEIPIFLQLPLRYSYKYNPFVHIFFLWCHWICFFAK